MNLPMNATAWKAARWAAMLVLLVVVVRVIQCGAASRQSKDDQIKAAEGNAAMWQRKSDSIDKAKAAEVAALRDTMTALDADRTRLKAITAHVQHEFTNVHVGTNVPAPRGPVSVTPLDSSARFEDTAAYVSVTRDNDPHPYVIPRFISSLLSNQHAVIDSLTRFADRVDGALRQSFGVIASDSAGIRARDSVIANTRVAEMVAKSRSAPWCGFKCGVLVGATGTVLVVGTAALLVSHSPK
jgi:hypothetical protein